MTLALLSKNITKVE